MKVKNNKVHTMELCLCSICAGAYYNTPGYRVRRSNHEQQKKEKCTYCNVRYGYDYLIEPANANMRLIGKCENRIIEGGGANE